MSRPKTLVEFFQVDKVKLGLVSPEQIIASTAHLVVDCQREYADPEYTKNHELTRGNKHTSATANQIAKISPVFRNLDIKTYAIYFYKKSDGPDPEKAGGGWYKFRPTEQDVIIGKTKGSAFDGTSLTQNLSESGKTNLIVSGFNTNACVMATVEQALTLPGKFRVCVVSDMTQNAGRGHAYKKTHLEQIRNKGAIVASSQEIMNSLPYLYHSSA